MGEYKAYRYQGGSIRGQEIGCSSDREAVFNTAEMDANAILEALNKKAEQDKGGSPFHLRHEPCHIIADDKAQIIEIRQDCDGLLMYYYDII